VNRSDGMSKNVLAVEKSTVRIGTLQLSQARGG
jgi:hypothetical protein